jgi:hypothetical protein
MTIHIRSESGFTSQGGGIGGSGRAAFLDADSRAPIGTSEIDFHAEPAADRRAGAQKTLDAALGGYCIHGALKTIRVAFASISRRRS